MNSTPTLHGKVALVAGGTRGAGRGIAVELGQAGATVYVTGRTTRHHTSDYHRQETIEETAHLVTEAGGTGIPVQVDHLQREQVQDLMGRIEKEHGHLDVLVNAIGAEHLMEVGTRFWETGLEKGLQVMDTALRTHLITTHLALPLIKKRGLVVCLTDGTYAYNHHHYRMTVFIDLAKTSLTRFCWTLAQDTTEREVTVVSLTPGWLRSEFMLDAYGVTEENWRDAIEKEPGFATSETPYFIGRAVAALAADPEKSRWSGQSLSSGQLAKVYGFRDVDGSQPDSWRYMLDLERNGKANPEDYR
ncbi:SDR family oxidoreductase [Deinococcus cellulosilyticus]